MTVPLEQLDDVVHQRYRLGILAYLTSVERVEFTMLRGDLNLTDGNLNRHLALLAEAGYVELAKPATTKGRIKTWVLITRTGRQALDEHVTALKQLLDQIDRPR